MAGQDGNGLMVPHGSFTLSNSTSSYTIQNLLSSTGYTLCVLFNNSINYVYGIYNAPVTTMAATPLASFAWTDVGPPGLTPSSISNTSLAFSPDGTPYLAYADGGANYGASVMKYSSGAWSLVGSRGISAGTIQNDSLAFSPDGTPYLAYEDGGHNNGATVMKFTGSAWSAVGNPGLTPNSVGSTSLTFGPDGSPYLAFQDGGGSNQKATVMKYNGTTWVNVGSVAFSPGFVNYLSIVFSPSGTPYVAFQDYTSAGGAKATVMMYNGSAWVNAGNIDFSAGQADDVSLAFSPSGTPYVAYSDYGNGHKATVMQLTGSSWTPVGNAGFSTDVAQYESLKFSPTGAPFVAYRNGANNNKANVMQYNGSAWVAVGSADFSEGATYTESLAFSPNGTPYLAYQDGAHNNGATVMSLQVVPFSATTTGMATAITASSATLNGTVGDNGAATAASFDYGTTTGYGTNVAATTPTGGTVAGGSGPTAVSVGLTGLSPNTTYHFRVDASGSSPTANGLDAIFTTNKITPVVTAMPTASAITFGQSLASSTLSGGTANVPGTFAWTDSTIVPSPAGTSTIYTYTFTPTDSNTYSTVTNMVSLTVNKATPTIATPPTASSITYGAALSTSALTNGVATAGSTALAGTFTWTSGATVPGAGTASYGVTFTPNDTTDYNTVTTTVSLTVNKATPTITTVPTASSITYGATLSTSTLTGGVGSVAGTFTWTNGSTVPGAGTASYGVTFTPTDTTDYNTVTTTVSPTVNKATPTITTVPTASSITYGAALSTSTLTGGVGSVAGTFTWTNGSTVPGAGTASYGVTFTPTDTTDYNTVTTTVSPTVNKATPTITTVPTASSITYGAALSTSTLTGGVGSVAGTFTWTNGSTVPGAGTASYGVTFTPTDTTDYNTSSLMVGIVVTQAAQAITLMQPASPVAYGSVTTVSLTATGGASGNAVIFSVASGPGTISGSMLTINGAGTIVINATQAGNTNYAAAATAQKSLVISKATSTLTGPTQQVFVVASQTGTIPITIVGQYPGASITAPGGTISYSITNSASTSVASGSPTIASGGVTVPVASTLAPGVYMVTLGYTGDLNYNPAATITVSLQVGQIQPTITWAMPAAFIYGANLTSALNANAFNGTSTVPGTYSYLNGASSVTSATILPAGAYTLTVNFTPTDTTTYKTATSTVTLTVNKATPAFSLASSTGSVLVQNLVTLTATAASTVSTPTGMVTFLDGTTSLGSSVLTSGTATLTISSLAIGTHSITAVYTSDPNFLTATSSATSVLVQDFNLNLSSSNGAGSPPSQTVLPGGTVVYSFTLAPAGSSSFPSAVNLTVSGLPTGVTYTITPATIAAGASSTNVALTITVPQQNALLEEGKTLAPIAWGLLLLPFSSRIRRRVGKMSRLLTMLLLLTGGLAGVAGLTGCGNSAGFFAQSQQTYNVTITGTSGALAHSTNVTLIVQ